MDHKELMMDYWKTVTRNRHKPEVVDSSITIREEMRKITTVVVSDGPMHILRRKREIAIAEVRLMLNQSQPKLSHKERLY